MLDNKTETLIAVAEQKNFTKAAEVLSLTQPAVSHQISQLEHSLRRKAVQPRKGELTLTQEGEIAVRYARMLTSMDQKMQMEIADSKRNIKKLLHRPDAHLRELLCNRGSGPLCQRISKRKYYDFYRYYKKSL